MSRIQTTDADNIIVGRVEPHIYAFETCTIPNYVKVGDTTRPVADRIEEWRRHYNNLHVLHEGGWVAKTENEKYFRDFAVHAYLESFATPPHHRLEEDELHKICPGIYYSREFFEGVSTGHIEAALEDINKDAKKESGSRYTYYSADRLPEAEGCFKRELTCVPRALQQQAIDRFKAVWEKNKDTDKQLNLLMYAVMRFGKSITSMICAKEMDAKIVLIVSAKTDVLAEWKHTVEAFDIFKGYKFLTQQDLKNPDKIHQVLSGELKSEDGSETYERAVIFLSLQDLSGSNKSGGLKAKFEELYRQNIDMMIIDETHYGARGESYGKVLQSTLKLSKSEVRGEMSKSDETFDDLDKQLSLLEKDLKVRVKLHLSGTPYRILMGSEFTEEDIIIQCQYSDIVKAKEEWDDEHCVASGAEVDDIDDKRGENPYFGFPQMIRFAFHPSESARQMMQREKENGHTVSLNDLFRPNPVSQTDNGKYTFEHQQEVLDLLLAIDGTKKDNGILPMLDYDRIRNGQLCHHMVWVLPLRASCDAMESLIMAEKKKFKHLQEYEIINIAGWTREKWLEKPNYVDIAKDKIRDFEAKGKKTITLTVNRMLTGVTVPEWDTMFFLKEASSPQEYDQAIFRLQSPYVVKRAKDTDGTSFAKFDMKPQTLLVDFDVDRMFYLQNQKALIGNINQNNRGGDELEKRHQRELEISPVLMMNLDGKLRRAEATDVIDAIRNYSAERSIRDEATDVRVDAALFVSEGLQEILMQYPPIDAKNAFSSNPNKGEGDDYSDGHPDDKNKPQKKDKHTNQQDSTEEKEDENTLPKRLANIISRIFFFAMLTNTDVKCITDIIEDIENSADAQRISQNIDLPIERLKSLYSHLKRNSTTCDTLSDIDLKIRNVRSLINDESIKDPIARVQRALKKFGRLSESEVVTPSWLAEKMVGLIPPETVTENTRFLDIAAKEGEFAYAIYKLHGEKVRNNIVSLPTSPLTYEFTRKVYALLGLPIENVISEFTAYDLINENANLYIETLRNMNFNSIVGNPPYNESGGSGGTNDAPIFQKFATISSNLAPAFTTMIIPSKWFTGGREHLLGAFRKRMLSCGHLRRMFAYSNGDSIFDDVQIKGGLCYYLEDHSYNGNCLFTHISNRGEDTMYRDLSLTDVFIRDGRLADIVSKIVKQAEQDGVDMVDSIISSDTPFGIPSNPRESTKSPFNVSRTKTKNCNIKLLYNNHSSRIWEYVREADIRKNIADIHVPKVFIPKAGGTGSDSKILGEPELAPTGSVCSQTFLYAKFETETEAENFITYLRTRFFRALVSSVKNTQDAMSGVYRFVPLQDFSEPWTDEKLYAKYGITPEEQQYIESLIKPMD